MGPKFDVDVQLSGEDGNAFAVMGRIERGLRRAGATQGEIDEFRKQATSGDYDHLLSVCMDWVKVH